MSPPFPPSQGMLFAEDRWDSMVFLPPFLAGEKAADRPSSTLPKKGSGSAKPEKLGQEQNENCVPAAPTPSPGILAVAALAQLHRPQASAGTRNCLVLPPGPHGEAMGLGPQSPGCAAQRSPAWLPSSLAREASGLLWSRDWEQRPGSGNSNSWRRPRGPWGWHTHANTSKYFLLHLPSPWAPTCLEHGTGPSWVPTVARQWLPACPPLLPTVAARPELQG